jgi:hypothetical protein
VARHTDSERIDTTRRAAIRDLLIGEDHMSAAVADAWIREWECEARVRGLRPGSDYWTIGLAWIHEQTRGR